MIVGLYRIIDHNLPKLKGVIWKQWYQLLARFYKRKDWTFMNYGYAPVDNQIEKIELNKADEENRYCIQLYHHVASAIDLVGLDVMEVGSGRGGGADFIKRHLKPNKMVGVDFSKNAVEFCNQNYHVNNLSFETGNAESLPVKDNSFDAIINIESSHCYGSMEAFLFQVKRVLKVGGHFLFADLRTKDTVENLKKSLLNSGLRIVKEVDITQNVVEALKLDNHNKIKQIKNTIHKPLVSMFLEFAGTEGSKIYKNFNDRENIYLSYVLQK